MAMSTQRRTLDFEKEFTALRDDVRRAAGAPAEAGPRWRQKTGRLTRPARQGPRGQPAPGGAARARAENSGAGPAGAR